MQEFGIEEVLEGDRRPAGAATMVVETDVPPHTHAFIELAFVVSGRARHTSSAGTRMVRRGDVVIVRPGSWHAYDRLAGLVVTNAYLRPALVHRELAWLMDQPSLVSGLLRAGVSFGTIDEPTLVRAVGWLDRLQALAEEAPTPVQLGLVTCALGELVDTDLAEAAGESWAVGSVVRETMAVLEEHPEHPWTAIELARLVMVSPSSLQRLFRAQVGRSPLEWLRQLRGERAATLLAQSDLPIAEIGRRVGWEDPNYMSRRFRMIYGVQPSAYRERFQAARRSAASSPITH